MSLGTWIVLARWAFTGYPYALVLFKPEVDFC
jgi:hypothetical protein